MFFVGTREEIIKDKKCFQMVYSDTVLRGINIILGAGGAFYEAR